MDKAAILKRVENALDSIRPHLEEDGGNIEVVEITDDLVAKVRWVGTCETCSMSPMTMKGGIEFTIRNHVPEITAIEPVNGSFVG